MQKVERRELYPRYAGIAAAVTNSNLRLAYEGLARQALLYAAKLDPAAVAKATARQALPEHSITPIRPGPARR
jgi:hypothetical protein